MTDDDSDGESVNVASRRQKERTPAMVEAQVLKIHSGSSQDQLADALCASDWLMSRARSIDVLMKQLAIKWIEENGPFSIGEIEHKVGYHTAHKCLDVTQVGHRVLEVTGGDVDQLLGSLSSQPYKASVVRSLLEPTLFASLFRYVRTGKLVNGLPEQVLKRADQRLATDRTRRGSE